MIIELKKGESTIGRTEMNQADGYVEDLLNCGHLDGPPFIKAFVVGHRVSDKITPSRSIGENPVRGKVQATHFGQLVRTAEARLFKLREKLQERYDDIPGSELLDKVLGESQQPLLTVQAESADTAQQDNPKGADTRQEEAVCFPKKFIS
ncbi:MAG: hypothetical protein BA864_00620 [Desulfuromonadales bacterium C00003093]|nr:MAG: hypothetical protein BA864_00620 [Desulfuromonadales bacterium C00003093]